MSLYTQLQTAKSEEDVKDAYIKALGLKQYTKGLIDIQTREIWFEAKDTDRNSSYAMFTQLLHYVQVALNKGEKVPPFLAVIDTEKAALMKSTDVLPFLAKKTVKWGKSASQYTQEALDEISAHIGTHFVSFKISTHEDEFISTVKAAIKSGDIIRTQITPDNLKQVFDKWVAMVGREMADRYPRRTPDIGETVFEVNANALHQWLSDFGPEFGWIRATNLPAVQTAANTGSVCVITGRRADARKSGHITCVIPESPQCEATYSGAELIACVQSQAGVVNSARAAGKAWWTGEQFRDHGFWVHE